MGFEQYHEPAAELNLFTAGDVVQSGQQAEHELDLE
jgi:hypothetical protein